MSEILMDGHYDCHFARTNRSSKKRCMQVGKRSQVHVKLKYTHHFYLHEVVLNPIKRRGELIQRGSNWGLRRKHCGSSKGLGGYHEDS